MDATAFGTSKRFGYLRLGFAIHRLDWTRLLLSARKYPQKSGGCSFQIYSLTDRNRRWIVVGHGSGLFWLARRCVRRLTLGEISMKKLFFTAAFPLLLASAFTLLSAGEQGMKIADQVGQAWVNAFNSGDAKGWRTSIPRTPTSVMPTSAF